MRAARRLVKKDPAAAHELRSALEILAEDPFHPRLRTHELQGDLAGCWAASVSYDLRIGFELVEHGNEKAILLESVGTHDEVY